MDRIFTFVILLVTALLLIPGCIAEEKTSTVEPKIVSVIETVAPNESVSTVNSTVTDFTADENVTSLNVTVNKKILVQLPENPTTGYTWNVTLTNGLELLNDTYIPDKTTKGMVGVGGVHEWIIQAIATGDQSFNGIYKQAWEPVSGNDTTYTLDLLVK